jgi:hypothetical protein
MYAAPLVGALLLAGCGGGGTGATPGQQATQGIAVGEPNGGAPVVSEFIKMAQGQDCAEWKNRLYVIDGKQVFWDRAGNCPDMSYSRVLFGFTPEQISCRVSDSIAGPQTFCADDQSRALFDTIGKNLDKADLGLAGHKVERVAFLPRAGTAISYETLASDRQSGVTAERTVVVKESATLEKLWAEHVGNRFAPPAMPKVDFTQQMVLAVFAGWLPNGCNSMGITRVSSGGDKIVVDYEERDLSTVNVCTQALVSPMQMVVVERSDAPVEFVKAKAVSVKVRTLDQTTQSAVAEARDVVIRDRDAWNALWAQHAPNAQFPAVDFDKQMVIGVFLGRKEGGCYTTDIDDVSLTGNKLTVHHLDIVPGPLVLCTPAITSPAHLVVVDRTDAQVVFAKEVVMLK